LTATGRPKSNGRRLETGQRIVRTANKNLPRFVAFNRRPFPVRKPVRSGRRITYRIMGYNEWLKDFFATWEYLRRMAPA
jgi:hypothetical protein